MTSEENDKPRGPRGGKTTRSEGFARKTFWIETAVEQALRREAFEREVSQAEIVREALKAYLDVPDEED